MVDVQVFSVGKTPERNEDFWVYTKNSFVVCDGATDKSDKKYDDKTGGEIVSRLVGNACCETDLNGVELVNYLNARVMGLYEKLKIKDLVKDPKYRFSCDLVAARLINDKLVITYLGDMGFRINGAEFFQEHKQVDKETAEERARYIRETGNLAGSRNHIMPLLLKQFEYQNNPDHELGYGKIDGFKTPKKFVDVFNYDLHDVKTLEIFTDGYFDIPEGTTIQDWENMRKLIEEQDPNKCLEYKSTKANDDRTVMIVKL